MRRLLLAALAVAALAAPAPAAASAHLPALTPGPNDALSRALERGALSEAQYALARAEALFRPLAAHARYGDVEAMPPRAATLVLRDLALRKSGLQGAERARAEGILARPFSAESRIFPRPDDTVLGFPIDAADDAQYSLAAAGSLAWACFDTLPICITFVTTTDDAIPLADSGGLAGWPDYLESVIAAVGEVWDEEIVRMGYRQPRPDLASPNNGGSPDLDIYLADLPGGLYGYCVPDDPKLDEPSPPSWDSSAYCVFDNDYLASEYGPEYTPEQNLQVTAAHELFHAVQFAYDASEDDWFAEGSATWMEDEVFDDVDQNRSYLFDSPLVQPGEPLDYDNPNTGSVYGAWIFFRYLSEHGDESLIRSFWERAGGAAGDPDDYSLEAIDNVLADGLGPVFADFAAANFFPALAYEEGDAYPAPRVSSAMTISKGRPSASKVRRLDHMASAYISVKPGAGVKGNARVRLALDFPARSHAPQARVVSISKSGVVQTREVRLSGAGDAQLTLPFGSLRQLIVVAVNAGARYDCWQGMPLACSGVSLDDGLPFRAGATLVQRR